MGLGFGKAEVNKTLTFTGISRASMEAKRAAALQQKIVLTGDSGDVTIHAGFITATFSFTYVEATETLTIVVLTVAPAHWADNVVNKVQMLMSQN